MNFFSLGQGPLRTSKNLILASASPRRQKLLAALGLHFQVRPSSYQELPPASGEIPQTYALDMARHKALDIAAREHNAVILAADTIVVLENSILGKPSDRQEALHMLTALCGKTHQVVTACCLLDHSIQAESSFAVTTDVQMPAQSPAILKAYIDSGEPMDKAGSYAIQGAGCFLVSSISGSYTNVVGLPLAETLSALLELQAVRPAGDSHADENSKFKT